MAHAVHLNSTLQALAATLRWETAEPEDSQTVSKFAFSTERGILFVEFPDGRMKAYEDVSFPEWIVFQAQPRSSPIIADAVRLNQRLESFRPGHAAPRENSDRLIRQALYDLEWHDVSSTNVRRIAYSEPDERLYVEFLDGEIYYYPDRKPGEWQSFLNAPSKGTWVHDVLRGAFGRRPLSRDQLDLLPYGHL